MRTWNPSVTVAAIVHQNDRFLLVEEHTSDGIRLNNPAGHLDQGESLIDAVVRETREEAAYRFAPEYFLGAYMSRYLSRRTGKDVTYLRFAFVGNVSDHDPEQVLDDGIIRALWMTIDEVRASADMHRSPLVLRCIVDYLAGQRLPLDAVYADPSVFHLPELGQ
jgi:8-oxo-dGTP pyrophosphatase MutT (NUDIX family)